MPPSRNDRSHEAELAIGRDIRRWQLALGLVALAVVWFVHDTRWWFLVHQAPWLPLFHLAMLAALVALGWAIAWVLNAMARTRGRQSTKLRRNTLVGAWALAGLAILGQSENAPPGLAAIAQLLPMPHYRDAPAPARGSDPTSDKVEIVVTPQAPPSNPLDLARPEVPADASPPAVSR